MIPVIYHFESVTFKDWYYRVMKGEIHACICLRVWRLLWKVWFRHQAFHSCQIFLSQSAAVTASLCSAKWAFLPENISTQDWTALPVLMKSFCQHEQKQCLSYPSTLRWLCSEDVYKTWVVSLSISIHLNSSGCFWNCFSHNSCNNNMNEIIFWFERMKKKSFQGFSNIMYNLVCSTYSQPPHNSRDLQISMWMMKGMTETQCTVSQTIKRLPHSESTKWNVTHTIHAVLFRFFQGMKSLVWAKTNRQESHTSEIKHIWTLLLYFHDIVFHVLSLGGFVAAAEIVSAWDYITEFYAFTQRISPQEETGTV